MSEECFPILPPHFASWQVSLLMKSPSMAVTSCKAEEENATTVSLEAKEQGGAYPGMALEVVDKPLFLQRRADRPD